jgi:hypothetical protein
MGHKFDIFVAKFVLLGPAAIFHLKIEHLVSIQVLGEPSLKSKLSRGKAKLLKC